MSLPSIPYTLHRSARRTLVIRVHPDQSVEVRAPQGMSLVRIRQFVSKRTEWITRQQQRFAASPPATASPRHYETGEVFRYAGVDYPLECVPLLSAHSAARSSTELGAKQGRAGEAVWLMDGLLHVATLRPDPVRLKRLITAWYREEARRVLHERFNAMQTLAVPLGLVTDKPLIIKTMKSRWGSCNTSGQITLNLHLVTVPLVLLDYVILHELCHLREMNHSKAFYALLARLCPEWKARRTALRHEGVLMRL
jgi:predicted metal-dependent hydrolase